MMRPSSSHCLRRSANTSIVLLRQVQQPPPDERVCFVRKIPNDLGPVSQKLLAHDNTNLPKSQYAVQFIVWA
jgi:hypothetical protein